MHVLRNQCEANKNGTIVFIDEANWLNDKSFEASAKRVFNGNQAKLSTNYFGQGKDGCGIFLDMPPMLIIVAGNNDIEDPALKSRFDCVSFPNPTKKALKKYALDLVINNNAAKRIKGVLDGDTVADAYKNELKTFIKDMTNFREIQSTVPYIINKWEEQADEN